MTTAAFSSDISFYDAFVNANLSPELIALGTTWQAVGSTPSVHARTHTATDSSIELGVPIFNLGGGQVAANYGDLWDGSIGAPVTFDEDGIENLTGIWTGTTFSGFARSGRELGNGIAVAFGGGFTNASWIAHRVTSRSNPNSVYGISGVLTAPATVPEPSSMVLVAIGLACLAGYRTRRGRTRSAGTV